MGLEEIDLSEFMNLSYICLRQNRLKSIPTSLGKFPEKLIELDLYDNLISEIDENSLKPFINLK